VSKRVEAPRLAEAPKAKEAARPPTQVALNVPPPPRAAEAKPTEAKAVEAKLTDAKSAPRGSIRDMAQRAKAAVLSIASNDRPASSINCGASASPRIHCCPTLPPTPASTGSLPSTLNQNPMLGGSPPYDRQTAVYDISAHMVYLPDGTKLEAHSGLGSRLDDPRSSSMKMVGVTRRTSTNSSRARRCSMACRRCGSIRSAGEDKIFNRVGLLAHTFMLGPNGDSNGCVSFKDYYAFLNAYRNQGIRRLAVLARVE